MLNFIAPGRSPAPKDDFGPEELRTWLSSLPNEPFPAARAMIEKLVGLNHTNMHGRLRLRLLDMFRDQVEWVLPQLERRLAEVAPPISGALRHTAYLVEKLLKELAAGYSNVVLAVPRSWLTLGFKSHLHVALARAMDFHARRLSLSHRLYARSPGAVWAEMHTLYRTAREWGLENRNIDIPATSPARVYRSALLLAFAQPTKLQHGDFPRVQSYLDTFGDLAEIITARPVNEPAAIFAVDPRRDRPGVALAKRPDTQLATGDLLLVTVALVERLESQLRRLKEGIAPVSLGLPDEAARPVYRELMQRLMANWRGDRKARSTRMQFHPRIELWVGLREIWRLLRAETPPEVGETAPAEGVPRSSQWIILNESARGFALKYMSGELAPVNVGEVVAIKARDRGAAHVCLVRWILSNSPEHFEVGLQQLGPVVVPAVYMASETDRVAPEPVLFFPDMPAQQRTAAVVAPANRLHANQSFNLRHRRGRLALRAQRVLEKTATIELIEVIAST